MTYIHGTHKEEQERLYVLNHLLNQQCLQRIILTGEEHILDIGSGLGVFSRMLARQLTTGKVVGQERSKEQLARARDLAQQDNESELVDFRQGNAYELTLEKEEWGSFDLIFIRFVLEHLSTPSQALMQARQALKSGGGIIVIDDDHANFRINPPTPAFEILWDLYCSVYQDLGTDPFIGRNLVSLLHQAGFREFKIDMIPFGATRSEPDFTYYADNLIGILVGARKEISAIGNLESQAFDRLIEEIKSWSQLEDATLWYTANWVEAIL